MWQAPAALVLMLLRQPGPDRPRRGFGTADAELSESIEIPEEFS